MTQSSEFEKQASARSGGTVSEIFHFLKHNKKWWLIPIVTMLLLIGAIVILSGTALAPFIYTLF